MRDVDEPVLRWLVLGVASGNPMFADKVVEVLNELHRLDPVATDRLFNARVRCNDAVADHPNLLVASDAMGWRIGIMGVLNGILAREDSCGSGVAAVLDNGVVVGFQTVNLNQVQ